MKFVLGGIALAAAIWFAMQTSTGRSIMHSVKTSAGDLASPIIGR